MARTTASNRTAATSRVAAGQRFRPRSFKQAVLFPTTASSAKVLVSANAEMANHFGRADGGSVALWLKPRALGAGVGTNAYIVGNYTAAGGWIVQFSGSYFPRLYIRFNNLAQFRSNSGLRKDGQNFMGISYNGNTTTAKPKFCIAQDFGDLDIQDATVSAVPSGTLLDDSANNFAFGNNAVTSGSQFNGWLEGIMFFNRTLTDDEWTKLYYEGEYPAGTLIDSWFDGSGATLLSETGLHDGTIAAATLDDSDLPFKARTAAI